MRQINFKSYSITSRFKKLSASSASIQRAACVPVSANLSWHEQQLQHQQLVLHWVAKILQLIILFFVQQHNCFTSSSPCPTPIGLNPGFLSYVINELAVKTSRDCVDCSYPEASFLMKFAKSSTKVFRRILKFPRS